MRRFAGDGEKGAGAGPVVVRVNAANLGSAMLAGAGSLEIDTLRGGRVTVGLRGPGRLIVDRIDADRPDVAMIGNGAMTLGGEAKQAMMLFSGSGAAVAGIGGT